VAESSGKNSLTIVLLVLIVIMGVEIVYLIHQNRRLQSMVEGMPALQVLQRGQTVPPLTATDLDGASVVVRYGGREPSTILIWFSPSCHICAENASFWNDIYDRYHSTKAIRFLAMSDTDAGETRMYVDEHALEFPVVCVTDERLVSAYNGHVMPQTALISPEGGIEKVWPGALEASRQDEIIAVLDSLSM
jgi:peroxiredoxin